MTDTDDSKSLLVSPGSGNLEATKSLVERRAALSNAKQYGVTPLLMAAQSGKM